MGAAVTVEQAWRRARKRWPKLDVPEAAYREGLRARGLGDEDLVDPSVGEDLYLVAACAEGKPAALQAFEDSYFDEIDVLLHREHKPELRDELAQQLRVKLFLAGDGRERTIASYQGKGSLRRWFRMVCARTLINVTTRRPPELSTSDDQLLDLLGGAADPELALIKKSYQRAFRAAFHAAFASLDEDDQGLLRSAFRDGLTVDALAIIHDVHRATAARWVVKAHQKLQSAIRALLRDDLHMNRSEIDSMFELIFSRMDITLSGRVKSETTT